MSPFEYRRIVKALEIFGGGFFQSFATCLQKADPINKVILLEAFRKMNKDDELWQIVQKDHPNLTDQERKQIFIDLLYQIPTNKEDSNEP